MTTNSRHSRVSRSGAIWEDILGNSRVVLTPREPLESVSPPSRGPLGLWANPQGVPQQRVHGHWALGQPHMVPMAPTKGGGANTVARRLVGG